MKILFIGDYSNLHACLAKELRQRGHHVDVLSDRCGYMDTQSDFYLARTPGIVGGFKYLCQLLRLLPQLGGYDVVQFINSNFFSLKPGKIKYFYDRLRKKNGRLFLTLAGNDYYFVKSCYDAEIFRFSEFKIGKEITEFTKKVPERMYGWISEENRRWSEYLYEDIDGAMAVLPEYDMAARPILGDKVSFTNLPVTLSDLPYTDNTVNDKVKIFVGMRSGMEVQKGTSILLNLAREIEKEMPERVEVERVSDVSLREYLTRMQESNIVLDQLYAYSPATNALQAMALGKVAGTGAQPEYYDYIGNPEERPVFSLSPEDTDIKERLIELVNNPEKIKILGKQGREIVERENDVRVVAERFLNQWGK